MALLKIKDFDPHYKETLGSDGLQGFDVYTDMGNDKVGTVQDILVNESGQLRYLIVDVGFWIFGKSVLVPVGRCRVNSDRKRILLSGFSKRQAEQLPEFTEKLRVDKDYERQVRGVYRHQEAPVTETAIPLTDLYGPGSAEHSQPINPVAPASAHPGVNQRQDPALQPPHFGHAIAQEAHHHDKPAPDRPVPRPVAQPPVPSHPPSATGWPGDPVQHAVRPEQQPTVAANLDSRSVDDLDEKDPFFYDLDEKDRLIMKLYQERLMARQRMHQSGSTTQPQ